MFHRVNGLVPSLPTFITLVDKVEELQNETSMCCHNPGLQDRARLAVIHIMSPSKRQNKWYQSKGEGRHGVALIPQHCVVTYCNEYCPPFNKNYSKGDNSLSIRAPQLWITNRRVSGNLWLLWNHLDKPIFINLLLSNVYLVCHSHFRP